MTKVPKVPIEMRMMLTYPDENGETIKQLINQQLFDNVEQDSSNNINESQNEPEEPKQSSIKLTIKFNLITKLVFDLQKLNLVPQKNNRFKITILIRFL